VLFLESIPVLQVRLADLFHLYIDKVYCTPCKEHQPGNTY